MAAGAFGKYVVSRALGSHGPVEVYDARDPQLDRGVAIKVLHPPEGAGADFEERFGREARQVAGLRHPHIVQVYDFAAAEGRPNMVMEYLEGGTLADRVAEYAGRGETLALPEVVRLLEPLADALDAAHSQGVIHGGLAPANVLFTARGQPVLTDFGLVQILGGLSPTNPAGSGAAAYVSPEHAASRRPRPPISTRWAPSSTSWPRAGHLSRVRHRRSCCSILPNLCPHRGSSTRTCPRPWAPCLPRRWLRTPPGAMPQRTT